MLHYYDYRNSALRVPNFGDDFNSWFLPSLFRKEIVQSERLVVVGIGTILNDSNAAKLSKFHQKVVFSSGVGYGKIENLRDDTWKFVCVRGPRSAQALNLAAECAVCDGAVLLSDQYPPLPTGRRDGTVFIPHVASHQSSGQGLQQICNDLGLHYLTPAAPFDVFIETVRTARLVVTEAMHGAIVADALRTPWIPFAFLHHHEFKWRDWFESVELPYSYHPIRTQFWDDGADRKSSGGGKLIDGYRQIKRAWAKQRVRSIVESATPILSADEVIDNRKMRLRDCVEIINAQYS